MNLWTNYSNKHTYSKEIKYEELIRIIKEKIMINGVKNEHNN